MHTHTYLFDILCCFQKYVYIPFHAPYDDVDQDNVRDAYLNVEMLLRIYLTLIISNCSGEVFFQVETMSQNRQVHLTLLRTESDMKRHINLYPS